MTRIKERPQFDVHEKYFPANDIVFGLMFAEKVLFEKLVHAITHKEINVIGEPYSQVEKRERAATLRSIRLDILAEAREGIFAVDMQRYYDEEELDKRMIMYGCRLMSTQVRKGKSYKFLKPVCVSFILAEADNSESESVDELVITSSTTGKVFSDLFTLYKVFVPTAAGNAENDTDLYVFSRFFEVREPSQAEKFMKDFAGNELAKELMKMYNEVTEDTTRFLLLEDEPYFHEKLSDEDKKRLRDEGRQEEFNKFVQGMLAARLPFEQISSIAKVPQDVIYNMAHAAQRA